MTSLPAFAGMQNAARPVAHQESPSMKNHKEQTAGGHHPPELEPKWLQLKLQELKLVDTANTIVFSIFFDSSRCMILILLRLRCSWAYPNLTNMVAHLSRMVQ